MNNSSFHPSDKYFWRNTLWMLSAAGFVLPLFISNMLLAMVVLANMLTGSVDTFRQRIRKPHFLFPVLFFMWCVASVAWSEHSTEAWHYAERKLALLALPFSFAFVKNAGEKILHRVAKAYVWSVTLAIIYSLQRAWVMYHYTGKQEYFFYHQLSSFIGINAVYFSVYVLLSMMLVWYYRRQIYPGFVLAYLFLHFTALLLLASKTVVIMVMLLLPVLFVPFFNAGRKYIFAGLVLLGGAAAIMLLTGDFAVSRLTAEKRSTFNIVAQDTFSYRTPFTGTILRLVLWKHAFQICAEQKAWLAGVGTGDFQYLLNERYAATGMFMGDSRRGDTGYTGYNPHNQFVEVFLSLGIIGLFLLLAWIISLWKIARTRTLFRLLLLFSVVIMCTECFLSANKGVVWFVFWIGILVSSAAQSVKEDGI